MKGATMNVLVVYQSNTGFTAQYAEWIAQALGGEAKPLKQVTASEISAAGMVIYGGWIFGNMISGLNKMTGRGCKPAAVFAVGATPANDRISQAITETNKLGDTPFFYLEGGFRTDKLSFFQKILLKMVKKMAAQKENKTEQDLFMEQTLGTSFNRSDKKTIEPLVTYCKGLNG